MKCSHCKHEREKHTPKCQGDSKLNFGVFSYRPCSCAKWVKPKKRDR